MCIIWPGKSIKSHCPISLATPWSPGTLKIARRYTSDMAVLSYWNLVVILPSLGFCHYYILPYFTIYKNLQHIPGPWLAKFSNTWLAFGARRGKKFAWVHWAHEKYGRIVRIGYNHVSIAEPEGLHAVYAHGNGFLKE